MKKLATLLYIGSLIALAACGEKNTAEDGRPSQEELKAAIHKTDDSLKIYYKEIMAGNTEKLPSGAIQKAIDAHLAYYHYYPKEAYAAECLDKVHQLYMQDKKYVSAVEICDTLIAKYPSYPNRNDVLLDAASTYDYMLRDTTHARKYYEMLLTSNKISTETKGEIEYRLSHLHLTLDEMIELQMKSL